MFGHLPKRNVYSPLEKGDHPELDTSKLCNPIDVQKYQSLVGSLQWAVSIGRMDITTAVMTLSSFRAVPQQGHLERAKRVVSYVAHFKESTIRFRTLKPDYSDIPDVSYDWTRKYDGAIEDIPEDAPSLRHTSMQTSVMTSLPEHRYPESYIGSTVPQSTGFPRNKEQLKQPHMDPNSWPHASAWNRSRHCVTLYATSVFPYAQHCTCSETTSQPLTVPCDSTPSCTNDIPLYPFIRSERRSQHT
jgi:hypothetical protein